MENQDTYVLTREILSSVRLTAQHFLWAREIGWNLHPTISRHLTEVGAGAAVADVACGNGLWTIEESVAHPEAQFTGLDISDAFFPREENWPSNVRFEKLNASVPVPERLCGRFDAVHCRLMMGAVLTGDPKPWVDNFLALLKPGGYLQWDEVSGYDQQTFPQGVADGKWNQFGMSMIVSSLLQPSLACEMIALGADHSLEEKSTERVQL
jgi:SAM-dependent methyltransferase